MKNILKTTWLFIFLLAVHQGFAQAGPDGFDDQIVDTPLDGGISLLVGAGIAYGVKRLSKNPKKTQKLN